MGREGLQPVCHSCDKSQGLKESANKSIVYVPAEAMPLIFSAELAAQQLRIPFNLIDINQTSVFQRLKFKLQGIPIPCVKIGDAFISGVPTKDEIVELYFNMVGTQSH